MMLAFFHSIFLFDMFDFFSKFSLRGRKNTKAAGKTPTPTATELASLQLAEDKKNLVEQARAATLAKIQQNAHDEAASIALLLTCDFADGRFQAAQAVHSQAGLEQVRTALLNIDKRVVKLMQTRLTLIEQAGRQQTLAQLCLQQAGVLLSQEHLLPNQVVDLDQQRLAVPAFPADLLPQFEQLRFEIGAKLQAQTDLQRRVLDLIAQMNKDATLDAAFEGQCSAWQQELDACLAHPQAASLPKQIVNECSGQLAQRWQRWQAWQQTQLKRQQQDAVRQAEALLPAAEVGDTAGDTAVAEIAVIALVPDASVENKIDAAASKLSMAQIVAAIEGMEDALAQGSIQNARKFERDLRAVDGKTAGLSAQQTSRLVQARNELGYLQGWAKWGGDVSRDELIKAVEELPALPLSANELAKKVAAMRERWKEMEAASGAANKDSWERFDAACKSAYAPAAAYFQEQAELRKINLAAAENALIELQARSAELLQGPPDWKAIANFCMQARQNWKKLGQIDRKLKTRLDDQFEAKLQLLLQPLQERRQEEIRTRENLIHEVAALDPLQRTMTEQLRALQERWQTHAASVPLRRKDEQALWEKFRAACDQLFAQRKLASGEAEAQRQENLLQRQELCAALEQATNAANATELSDVKLAQLLQQTATAWRNAGPVPRAQEAVIEQRYQNAQTALKQISLNLQEQKKQKTKTVFLQKLALCQKLEQLLISEFKEENSGQQMAQLSEQWQQMAALPARLDRTLNSRFQAALLAFANDARNYHELMLKNTAHFDASLLQLEILSGIASPAELARERMQMQVEVLQNALKRGAAEQADGELLQRLLSLPALLDESRTLRLEKVLAAAAVL